MYMVAFIAQLIKFLWPVVIGIDAWPTYSYIIITKTGYTFNLFIELTILKVCGTLKLFSEITVLKVCDN